MKLFTAISMTVLMASSSGRAAEPRADFNASPTPPPNFVVIFTDDQGYADVGCFGSPDIRTPRLDAMAAEGMKFTSFYAQPICGPSRAALMTGCYPLRVAERGNIKQIHPILHSDEITIAEVLRTKDYATACFGKWDLAKHSQENFFIDLFPTRQGFDYFFGTPTSNDRIANLYRNEELIEPKTDLSTLTQRYTDEAIKFMQANKEQPFFVYIPHSMPHTRLDASPQFKGKSKRGLYGDVIEEIDFNVGRILDSITEMGLAHNTYVIFTSDNGPWLIKNKNHADGHLVSDHGGSAGPLRSGKVSTFEGGVRVPTIAWGPGRVPANTTCDAIASTMDILPTFAALANAEVPTDRVIDGDDIRHLLHGDFDKANAEKAYFYYLRVHLQAVRQGKWKLHLPRQKEPIGAAPFSRNTHIAPADRIGFPHPFLIDLDKDIAETTNVVEDHPEVVEKLLALAEEMRKDLGDYDRVGEKMRFFDLTGERPAKPPVPAKPQRRRGKPAPKATPNKANNSEPETTQKSKVSPSKPAEDSRPNFVVIFADDLGYGDLSCYRPTGVQTPHLDKLAAEGFRSTDFFVPANVCSPSRASLLTGRYPMRCGLPVARNEGYPKYKNYGFAPEELTIPELLKPAGYRSLMVGKWHLGMAVEGSHPLDAGFDEHLGIPSNFAPSRGPNHNTLYRGREIEKRNTTCEELTERYTDEVLKFIERNKEEPFLIYVSHHIVHTPLKPSKDFVGTSKKGRYGDFVNELNHSTGRIMQAIRDAGIDDNTLVVFTSDNGPTGPGSAGGLNGGKYCTMEGGHRVPGIFRWPGKIPAGQVSNTTLTSMDLLPTLCELAGVKLPGDRKIDGKNIFPILQGEATESPHEFLYYYNGTNLQAVRQADWKLHLPRTGADQPFWSKPKKSNKKKGFVTLDEPKLFNLKTDLGEKMNVADKHHEVVIRLQKQAEKIRTELGDVRVTGTDQRSIKLSNPQER